MHPGEQRRYHIWYLSRDTDRPIGRLAICAHSTALVSACISLLRDRDRRAVAGLAARQCADPSCTYARGGSRIAPAPCRRCPVRSPLSSC